MNERSIAYLAAGMALVVCLVDSSNASASSGPGASRKSLQRTVDSIVLAGGKLAPLLGVPIDDVRVLAFDGETPLPVPFQIDERDQKGSYIFRTSSPEVEDADNGLFDTNDELVFMCKDTGDRMPAGWRRPEGVFEEIAVRDPVDGGVGWCYATTKDTYQHLSPVDYVRYDPARDAVYAQNYNLDFSRAAPNSYADTAVTPAGGGNGARLNDRVVIRLDASAVFKLVHIRRSEEDFRSTLKGYIDGPVRVVKRVGNSIRQVFGIYGPEIEVDYTFYFSNWIMPSVIDLPVDVGKYLSQFDFRGGTHWTPAAKGMVFYTKYIPPGTAVIDGHMSEAEKQMDLRLDIGHIWHCYTGALTGGGQGSILFRILMDDFLVKTLQVKTYYYDRADDPDFVDDPVTKDEYRRFFEGSYVWMGMEKLPKGRYHITSWATIMPDYARPGDEQRYLDVLDRPLEVTVREASAQGGSRKEEGMIAPLPYPEGIAVREERLSGSLVFRGSSGAEREGEGL